jgi:hypothetical protein
LVINSAGDWWVVFLKKASSGSEVSIFLSQREAIDSDGLLPSGVRPQQQNTEEKSGDAGTNQTVNLVSNKRCRPAGPRPHTPPNGY